MKTTPIPERSRDLVKARERFRCARCQIPSPNGHWHHRRSRSVRDSHTHCACNGVWLCSTCHTWAHQNPTAAREAGLILLRSQSPPGLSPFKTPTGWVLPDCDGGWSSAL